MYFACVFGKVKTVDRRTIADDLTESSELPRCAHPAAGQRPIPLAIARENEGPAHRPAFAVAPLSYAEADIDVVVYLRTFDRGVMASALRSENVRLKGVGSLQRFDVVHGV